MFGFIKFISQNFWSHSGATLQSNQIEWKAKPISLCTDWLIQRIDRLFRILTTKARPQMVVIAGQQLIQQVGHVRGDVSLLPASWRRLSAAAVLTTWPAAAATAAFVSLPIDCRLIDLTVAWHPFVLPSRPVEWNAIKWKKIWFVVPSRPPNLPRVGRKCGTRVKKTNWRKKLYIWENDEIFHDN